MLFIKLSVADGRDVDGMMCWLLRCVGVAVEQKGCYSMLYCWLTCVAVTG